MYRITFIIFSFMLLSACGNQPKEATKTAEKQTETTGNTVTLTAAQQKNTGITTGRLQQKVVSATLKVSGQIDVPPQNIVTISVPMGGYLQSTTLLPGQHVRKGQGIAVVQDNQYVQLQQDYLTAQTNLTLLKREYERQKDLNTGKAISDKQYQQTEADYRIQQVTVKALSEKLKLANIDPERLTAETISRNVTVRSPIDGYVARINVNVGKYVNPADVLFEIVNPGDIHLALNVFEKDLGKLHIGQKVTAYSNAQPGKVYQCRIILINRNVSQDRSVEVHCHFDQSDKLLVPGMFMNAEVQLDNYEAPVLPQDAIVMWQNQSYVFAVKGDGQYDMVPVTAGSTQEGLTEVTFANGQPAPEALFVTHGAYALLMQLKNTGGEE